MTMIVTEIITPLDLMNMRAVVPVAVQPACKKTPESSQLQHQIIMLIMDCREDLRQR